MPFRGVGRIQSKVVYLDALHKFEVVIVFVLRFSQSIVFDNERSFPGWPSLTLVRSNM